MQTFWSFLGWSIVALTGLGYLWVAYRFVLFPKQSSIDSRNNVTRRVA